jgi:protein-S-isoprenylcysteine O-methyltransferase Ste14
MEKMTGKTAAVLGGYVLVFWLLLPGFLLAVGRRLDALVPVNLMKDAWFNALGWILVVSGFTFMAGGMEQLWSRGKGLPVSHLPPRRFVASGFYRFIRHPIYLGFSVAFAGAAVVIGSFWSLAFSTPLLSAGWIAYVLTYEEPALLVRFGES